MIMNECSVNENCDNFLHGRDTCWMCEDYGLYIPIDKKILSPMQIRKREERKAERKRMKNSEESKRSKRAKKKGAEGEREVVDLLKNYRAERIPLSGALHNSKYACDVTFQLPNDTLKRIEVKRRKSGLTTIYKWMEQDKMSNYLFMRQDNQKWLVVMPIEEFLLLVGDLKCN